MADSSVWIKEYPQWILVLFEIARGGFINLLYYKFVTAGFSLLRVIKEYSSIDSIFSILWTPNHETKKARFLKLTYFTPFVLSWVTTADWLVAYGRLFVRSASKIQCWQVTVSFILMLVLWLCHVVCRLLFWVLKLWREEVGENDGFQSR